MSITVEMSINGGEGTEMLRRQQFLALASMALMGATVWRL